MKTAAAFLTGCSSNTTPPFQGTYVPFQLYYSPEIYTVNVLSNDDHTEMFSRQDGHTVSPAK